VVVVVVSLPYSVDGPLLLLLYLVYYYYCLRCHVSFGILSYLLMGAKKEREIKKGEYNEPYNKNNPHTLRMQLIIKSTPTLRINIHHPPL